MARRWNSKFKDEYCEELIEHMSQGADFKSFAGKVGVTEPTLHAWKKSEPEFATAYAHAIEKCYAWWERLLREYIVVEKGKPRADVGLLVLNMRNRFKWSSKDVETVTQGDKLTPDEIYAEWEKSESER